MYNCTFVFCDQLILDFFHEYDVIVCVITVSVTLVGLLYENDMIGHVHDNGWLVNTEIMILHSLKFGFIVDVFVNFRYISITLIILNNGY